MTGAGAGVAGRGRGRKERSMAAMEMSPVGSGESIWKDSMEMVPAGQRAAQSPQRMQRVSSLSMTDPARVPSSSV